MDKNNNQNKITISKLKRLFDVVFSFMLLIITAPFSVLILVATFFESALRGHPLSSLFYIEKRISQGKTFNFIKFNIFKPGIVADMKKQGIFVNTKILEHDGKSLTITGRLLQHIYLDELPQLASVLRGDISMVGPRPVNLEVYERDLKRGIITRTFIKTGLTGNSQSQKGINKKGQVELDKDYINFCRSNSSWKILLFDIKIIFRTLLIIFRAEGI